MKDLPTNDLIREKLGPNHPVPLGWVALVETHTTGTHFKSADGSDSEFIRADTSIERDQYHSCLAQILMLGDACFQGEKFKYWKIMPKVGDYVKIKKYGGVLNTWTNPETGKTVHIQEVEDVLLRFIIPDPSQSVSHNFLGK